MTRRWVFALMAAGLIIGSIVLPFAFAGENDAAEAKERGVAVEVVQLEKAKAQIAELQAKNKVLEAENAAARKALKVLQEKQQESGASPAAPGGAGAAAGRPAAGAPPQDPVAKVQAILADLKLTAEQQEKAGRIAGAAIDAWRAAWNKDQAELEKIRDEVKAAAAAGEDQKVEQLQRRAREILHAWPSSEDTLTKIREILTPEQTKLMDLRSAVRSAVGVHEAILHGPNPPAAGGADNERCMACHMPHYPTREQREAKARQEKENKAANQQKP